MGRLKIWNDAGLNDDPNNITSYENQVGRISEFIENLEQLTTNVDANSQAVQNMIEGSSTEMDSFKEVSDNINIEDFLAGLEGQS